MAQSTNLNVSPYFDDINADDNYYKILFKPGLPVQARELTGLQSILQDQISKFGQHIFKEGAKVIPGNTSYDNNFACVEINNEYLGVTVKSYIDQLLNQKIVGLTSGVAATIIKILDSTDSIRDNLTLYVRYDSSSINNENSVFQNGELLASNTGTSFIINQAIKGINNPEEILIVNHLRVALIISDYILSNKIK